MTCTDFLQLLPLTLIFNIYVIYVTYYHYVILQFLFNESENVNFELFTEIIYQFISIACKLLYIL